MSTDEENPISEEEIEKLLTEPIELPAGTLQIEHNCPTLEYEGYSTQEATFIVELFEEERPDGWRYGYCKHCGMNVKARV
ncbi:MAG TPA: hypothetical protein VFS21_03295 [Roseiflexaceae bacterium]|nr:hypothetical protein [Roseiflexaceae bacterium]